MKQFIILLALFTVINAFTFNCNYVMNSGNYWCTVNSVSGIVRTRIDATVTAVTGTHVAGKTNNDVATFDIRGQGFIRFFPRQLNRYFPNLSTIYVENGLREIRKEDLKYFPYLQNLYISHNRLEILEKDLFTYNPQLVLLKIDNNNFKYIDPNVFDNLSKLTTLAFVDNFCQTGLAENDRNGVLDLIDNIRRDCNNSTAF